MANSRNKGTEQRSLLLRERMRDLVAAKSLGDTTYEYGIQQVAKLCIEMQERIGREIWKPKKSDPLDSAKSSIRWLLNGKANMYAQSDIFELVLHEHHHGPVRITPTPLWRDSDDIGVEVVAKPVAKPVLVPVPQVVVTPKLPSDLVQELNDYANDQMVLSSMMVEQAERLAAIFRRVLALGEPQETVEAQAPAPEPKVEPKVTEKPAVKKKVTKATKDLRYYTKEGKPRQRRTPVALGSKVELAAQVESLLVKRRATNDWLYPTAVAKSMGKTTEERLYHAHRIALLCKEWYKQGFLEREGVPRSKTNPVHYRLPRGVKLT